MCPRGETEVECRQGMLILPSTGGLRESKEEKLAEASVDGERVRGKVACRCSMGNFW
jgi:hypothetical protein